MKRNLFSAAAVLVAVVATGTESRSDNPSAAPTVAQQAARTQFMEEVAPAVKKFKENCGSDLVVTTDFQNYDRAALFAASSRDKPRQLSEEQRAEFDRVVLRDISMRCADAIETAQRYCPKAAASSGSDRDRPRRRPPSTPVVGPEVKEVACLFAGYQAQIRGDDTDDLAQRNISFANGVLTIRNHPAMGNIEENTRLTLRPPKPSDHGNRIGTACTTRDQCASLVCSGGKCTACGPTASCEKGWSCFPHGRCVKELARVVLERDDNCQGREDMCRSPLRCTHLVVEIKRFGANNIRWACQ